MSVAARGPRYENCYMYLLKSYGLTFDAVEADGNGRILIAKTVVI